MVRVMLLRILMVWVMLLRVLIVRSMVMLLRILMVRVMVTVRLLRILMVRIMVMLLRILMVFMLQLAYCVVQFLEKDSTLTEPVRWTDPPLLLYFSSLLIDPPYLQMAITSGS